MAVADLMAGEWADIKVVLANPAGKTGGFYVKAMLPGARPVAVQPVLHLGHPRRRHLQLAAATLGDFEDDLNGWFPSSTAADYAIFESGLVDAATYVEQGLKWKDAHWAYLHTSSARTLSPPWMAAA